MFMPCRKARLSTWFLRVVWIASFLHFGNIARAQIESVPGYMVLSKGDTTRGFIENRSKSSDYGAFYFSKNQGDKSTVYTPKEVLAYGLHNLKYYERITIKDMQGNDQQVFGAIVQPGRATLFRYQKDLYLRHDSLGMYSLHFNTIRDLQGMNKIRGVMNYAFSDCKTMDVKWETVVLTDEKIEELVRKYNECKHSRIRINPSRKTPALKGSVGIVAGINMMTLQMSSFQTTAGTIALKETKFETNTTPIFGVNFGLSFPRLNRNFSIYLEGSYFKSDITGHSSVMGVSSPETVDLNFKADYFKLGYGVRVLFPAKRFTGFAKAGLSNYIDSNFSNVYTHVVYVNGNPVTQVSSPWTSGSQMGLWIGGGIQRRVAGKLAMSLEARYDRTSGYNGPYPAYPLNGSHITILLGIGF